MLFPTWENLMRNDPETQITLRNLERDRNHNRCRRGPATFADFENAVQRSPHASAIDVFNDVRESLVMEGHPISYTESLATVTDMRAYVEWMKIGSYWSLDHSALEYRFMQMQKNPSGDPVANCDIGPPVTWTTPFEALEAKIDSLPDSDNGPRTKLADDIRDEMGLARFRLKDGKPVYLVYLPYRSDSPDSSPLHNPTVFDGDARWYWRSYGDDSDWGRTVNLDTLADGMPEAVHEGFEITPEDDIRASTIGRIENPPPTCDTAGMLETIGP